MAARTSRAAIDPSRDALEAWLRARGLSPRWWSNGPGDTYARHDHPYHKVLFCSEGAITFHLDDGDVTLQAGDRIDIEPATGHGATVGDTGVTCVEAQVDDPSSL